MAAGLLLIGGVLALIAIVLYLISIPAINAAKKDHRIGIAIKHVYSPEVRNFQLKFHPQDGDPSYWTATWERTSVIQYYGVDCGSALHSHADNPVLTLLGQDPGKTDDSAVVGTDYDAAMNTDDILTGSYTTEIGALTPNKWDEPIGAVTKSRALAGAKAAEAMQLAYIQEGQERGFQHSAPEEADDVALDQRFGYDQTDVVSYNPDHTFTDACDSVIGNAWAVSFFSSPLGWITIVVVAFFALSCFIGGGGMIYGSYTPGILGSGTFRFWR